MNAAGADHKQFSTCQARAALRGVMLSRIESDDGKHLFVATFHALTKSFDDLAEVERWLERVDGKRVGAAA